MTQMAEQKLFAGHAIRRLRRTRELTQAAMASALSISPSYLTLIERNQRPLTAALMVALAEQFDFDARSLAGAAPGGGAGALRRRLSDPLFADLEIDRTQLADWIVAAPDAAEAFARAFDRLGNGAVAPVGLDVIAPVRREIERWRNHFADLDVAAEALSDELRLSAGDLYGAMADRLRVKHQLSVRILPVDIMPDKLRRLDLHARQLQLSELLDPASRSFATAFQLGQSEAKAEIEALVSGAGFTERASERLFRRHLTSYFAAAVMMPYARFLRACESTGYDVELLQRRFGAGFEQVAHRLTTLQRPGARGVPFFLIRTDRAGQISKRFAAGRSPLARMGGNCPLWSLHAAFDRPGAILTQVIETEDGARWLTMSRTVRTYATPHGTIRPNYAIALGCELAHGHSLTYARGLDLDAPNATPIGLACHLCERADCRQRSAPPASRRLVVDERSRGINPFRFTQD